MVAGLSRPRQLVQLPGVHRGRDQLNLGYISDEQYDALIDDAIANTSSNRDQAEQDYIDLQKMIYDNADMIPMYDMVDVYVVSNAVQGVYENPAYPTCINYYNVTSK